MVPVVPGGDLHYHLSQHGVFSEAEMRFYAAEIILGLEHMHSRFVVYRDLKVPDLAGTHPATGTLGPCRCREAPLGPVDPSPKTLWAPTGATGPTDPSGASWALPEPQGHPQGTPDPLPSSAGTLGTLWAS